MRLLILTQKIDENDDNLSFFADWVAEFGMSCDKVSVICLYKGQHNFNQNITVYSLGKEELGDRSWEIGDSFYSRIFTRVRYALRFYKYIWQLRKEYDAVFVHMNPEYVVLGGALWRLWNKKVGLWYTHHSITIKLRMAMLFTSMVFTPVAESFRLKTRTPVHIVGHGINTEKFKPKQNIDHAILNILSDTRIARSKHVERSLEISRLLKEASLTHSMNIVGGPILEDDKIFYGELQQTVKKENLPVNFIGPVPYNDLPSYYQEAEVFINHANPGGLNKVPLQAMACNLYGLTSNEAYRGILPDDEIVNTGPQSFVEKIISFAKSPIKRSVRERVVAEHSLPALVTKILSFYL